jgi:hypothetical protein
MALIQSFQQLLLLAAEKAAVKLCLPLAVQAAVVKVEVTSE